jgi:hypothetical protein
MLTFIAISGIIILLMILLAVLGAYHDYKDAEEYKPYYDGRDE